jgi:hypothetical protein
MAKRQMRTIASYEAERSEAVVSFLRAFPGVLQALNVGVPLDVAWKSRRILSFACLSGFILRHILLVSIFRERKLINSDVDHRVALRLADSIEDDCILRLVVEGHAWLGYDAWDGGLDGVELKLERAGLEGCFDLDKKQSLQCVPFLVRFELDS